MQAVTPLIASARSLDGLPHRYTLALAASATTDGMDITATAVDYNGAPIAGVRVFDLYMSEDANGIGLTGDTYSGSLTAVATYGAVLSTLTTKKHFRCATNANGVFKGTLVDSANPADQYAVACNPAGGAVAVSAVSGTNWEGV